MILLAILALVAAGSATNPPLAAALAATGILLAWRAK